MQAYRDAIRSAVHPGDIVLDVGTGTGILAFLACQAGAARVYAVEETAIIDVARQLAKTNDLNDRIVFIQKDVRDIQLPEPVDAIISELISKAVIGQQQAELLSTCRERFLKPGGKIVPKNTQLWIAPITAQEKYEDLELPKQAQYGLDFSHARRLVFNHTHSDRFEPEAFLAKEQSVYAADFMTVQDTDKFEASLKFHVYKADILNGFCGWFSSTLAEEVILTNYPPGIASWDNLFLPLLEPLEVKPGMCVELHLKGQSSLRLKRFWQWKTEVRDGDVIIAQYNQSTFWGMPPSLALLRKQAEVYVPTLNEAGRIDWLILTLMKKATPVGDIARAVSLQFPARFASWQDAQARVGDLARRYSE